MGYVQKIPIFLLQCPEFLLKLPLFHKPMAAAVQHLVTGTIKYCNAPPEGNRPQLIHITHKDDKLLSKLQSSCSDE